jgi:predicted O-methyltransferase YrrM
MSNALKSLLPTWMKRRIRATVDGAGAIVREIQRRRVVAGLGDLGSQERVGVAYAREIDMWHSETLVLYALTRALKPRRVLEIGAFRGGSGLIFSNALEDAGDGRIVGIDPAPQFEPDDRYHGRYTLVRGTSPDAVEEAVQLLGGSVDLALIDGMHTYSAVRSDLEAVLPHMAVDSYILHHDAFHYGINRAAEEFSAAHPDVVSDCGVVSRTATLDADPWVAYAGLRLLRVNPQRGVEHIRNAYESAGKPVPRLDDTLSDHDRWSCGHLGPCARCREEAKAGGA